MDVFTIFRVIKGNFCGFCNYINFEDKKRIKEIKYLFVDVTEIHRQYSGTGVQRVTDNILKNLYKENLPYKIVEIYAKPHHEGFYVCESNKPVKIRKGDFFFGLDLSKCLIPCSRLFLDKIYRKGIPVWFFLHDLIAVHYPQYFKDDAVKQYRTWLKTVIRYTGIIANSDSTVQDLKQWIGTNHPDLLRKLKTGYSYLGSTFSPATTKSCTGSEPDCRPVFLMVSTVEPRKKYDQCVRAFQILWDKGIDSRLIIVGRKGWKNEDTFSLIENSPYYEKKLFWYSSGISDERLSALYQSCTAVIFASIAEGYGLAVVEAASYGKPLILRDLPVFREIAGNSAFYFTGQEPDVLAAKIEEWLLLYTQKKHPLPDVKITSWEECTHSICRIMLNIK